MSSCFLGGESWVYSRATLSFYLSDGKASSSSIRGTLTLDGPPGPRRPVGAPPALPCGLGPLGRGPLSPPCLGGPRFSGDS